MKGSGFEVLVLSTTITGVQGGTSLVRHATPKAPYSSPTPSNYGDLRGEGQVLMSEVPLYGNVRARASPDTFWCGERGAGFHKVGLVENADLFFMWVLVLSIAEECKNLVQNPIQIPLRSLPTR